MAIDKMTLVSIEGQLKKVNRTLISCCESECFHIIPYVHDDYGTDANLSSQRFKPLKMHNYYTPLVKRALNISHTLGIALDYTEHDDVEYVTSSDFSEYFDNVEAVMNRLVDRKMETEDLINQFNVVLSQVEHLSGLQSSFEDIFAMNYVRVRFGRLPLDSFTKLRYFDGSEDRLFTFHPFETQGDYIWGLYFTPRQQHVVVDELFKSLFFERIRYPDYLTGTAEEAKAHISEQIERETARLKTITKQLNDLRTGMSERFIQVYCKLKTLHDSYDLRANVAAVNNKFFLSGYVPSSEVERFVSLVEQVDTVQVEIMPHTYDAAVRPPVKLKNNRLVKPFEMFVNMYGLPSYGRIDPTPFVAVTYFLIYGIMFGDLGQGLVISLLGALLYHRKKMKLASIMIRIGISSAIFGTLYGSVFGREDIIHPFFMNKTVYQFLGFSKAPADIFEISSFLLLAAMFAGVLLILITITMNIIGCFRIRDFKEGILSPNGIVGLVFYSSAVVGATLQLGFNIKVFSVVYVMPLIIFPLVLLFFKEPIADFWDYAVNRMKHDKIYKNTMLINAAETYSDAVSKLDTHIGGDFDLEELLECEYIKYQYGILGNDGYEKLKMYKDRKFFFFPFESDSEIVKGMYIAPEEDFPAIDKMMSSLGFIKQRIPPHIHDIRKETQKLNTSKDENKAKHEGKSVSNFIIESLIELFENTLTYVTNTMSFLRVGGFILSHAGLMLVVNILAERAGETGSVGWIIVQILGNAFVVGMEGFLVGIQVLRLEFYEMFSRFHKSGGKPFEPIVIDYKN